MDGVQWAAIAASVITVLVGAVKLGGTAWKFLVRQVHNLDNLARVPHIEKKVDEVAEEQLRLNAVVEKHMAEEAVKTADDETERNARQIAVDLQHELFHKRLKRVEATVRAIAEGVPIPPAEEDEK